MKMVKSDQPKKLVGPKSKPSIVHIYFKQLIAGRSRFRSTYAKEKKKLADLKRRMKLITSLGQAHSGMHKFNQQQIFSHVVRIQVTFSSFNFASAVQDPLSVFKSGLLLQTNPDPVITWDDGKPRIAKSADGIDLVLHVPDFLRSKRHVCFYYCIFVPY